MIADRNRLQQTKTVKSSSFRRSKLRPRKQPDSAERSVKDKTDGHHANSSSGSVAYSDDCDRSIRVFSDGKHMTCIYSNHMVHAL
jgi:molybdenum cofactor biosynthesis enzyme MoaA